MLLATETMPAGGGRVMQGWNRRVLQKGKTVQKQLCDGAEGTCGSCSTFLHNAATPRQNGSVRAPQAKVRARQHGGAVGGHKNGLSA
jgi:hypothetical protein